MTWVGAGVTWGCARVMWVGVGMMGVGGSFELFEVVLTWETRGAII